MGTATTGAGGEPADHAGQGALEPGHHDDGVGRRQVVGHGQQPVHPGHPAVGHQLGRKPRAPSTARHSAATARSAVPAVTTRTRPARAGAGRQTTVAGAAAAVTTPPSCPAAAAAASAALTWSWSARVSSTGPPGSASSSATMAAHWSGVLPGP